MAPISTTRPWYTYVTARELLLDAPVLPDALRTLLLDLPKLKKSIPKALRTAPPQRPLEFGSSADYSSADRIAHKLNFDKRERNTLIALLTAVAGVRAPSPCGVPACEKNFARCIVLSPALCEGLGETYRKFFSLILRLIRS